MCWRWSGHTAARSREVARWFPCLMPAAVIVVAPWLRGAPVGVWMHTMLLTRTEVPRLSCVRGVQAFRALCARRVAARRVGASVVGRVGVRRTASIDDGSGQLRMCRRVRTKAAAIAEPVETPSHGLLLLAPTTTPENIPADRARAPSKCAGRLWCMDPASFLAELCRRSKSFRIPRRLGAHMALLEKSLLPGVVFAGYVRWPSRRSRRILRPSR